MASDPRIRASDADRDRTAEALREHHAAGRLTMEEFNDRLDRVYAAKTLGELDELMRDLPAIDLYQLPIPASQRPVPAMPPQPPGRLSPVWRAAWASWASITVLCIVIWLLTSPGGYFWPAWVAVPWGAMMGVRWLMGAAPRDHARRDELHSRRHDRRGELRAQRSQLRHEAREAARDARSARDVRPGRDSRSAGGGRSARDIRSSGGGVELPWDPHGTRGGEHGDR